MAPGPPPARTPGTSRTPPSCAASWAVARLWRHREQVTSVPAWGRRGRMPVAAPGPRRQSGPVRARHGATAGAAVGQVPSAQVSAVHPQTGGRGTIPGQCRDPRPPLQISCPCGWRAAAAAAPGAWRCCTTAPGAAFVPTAPAPPRPSPPAASWAAGTGGGWSLRPPGTRPPPGWPGWAARRGPTGSGDVPRHPGACRTAAPAGTPMSPVTRTVMARAGRPPRPQVAVPVPATPAVLGWPGSPPHAARPCPRRCPQQHRPDGSGGVGAGVHGPVCGPGDAAVPGAGRPGRADVLCPGSAPRWVLGEGAGAEPVWGSWGSRSRGWLRG